MARKRMRIQLVFKRSSPITKAALLAAVVMSTIALLALHGSIRDSRAQYEAMRAQAALLESRNTDLSACMENVGSVEGIARIAMEELGLVYPDTVIFEPED